MPGWWVLDTDVVKVQICAAHCTQLSLLVYTADITCRYKLQKVYYKIIINIAPDGPTTERELYLLAVSRTCYSYCRVVVMPLIQGLIQALSLLLATFDPEKEKERAY